MNEIKFSQNLANSIYSASGFLSSNDQYKIAFNKKSIKKLSLCTERHHVRITKNVFSTRHLEINRIF